MPSLYHAQPTLMKGTSQQPCQGGKVSLLHFIDVKTEAQRFTPDVQPGIDLIFGSVPDVPI